MIADFIRSVKEDYEVENYVIRQKAREKKIPLWRIAAELGISEPTITRWMRFPLTSEREKLVESAIDKLSQEGI